MAVTPVVLTAATGQALADVMTTALTPLTQARIFGLEIDQIREVPYYKKNLYAAFTYDTVGATLLTAPFQVQVFARSTEAQVVILANQFIAANPTYFFSSIYISYVPYNPDPDQAVLGFIVYNTDGTAGLNWEGGNSSSGPAGGDLYGAYPNPQVGGLRGVPIAATPPTSGQQLVYDGAAGQYVPTTAPSYYVSGAAAQAAAPHINGTFVVISPGSPTSDAGTWQVTANQGVAFPADYTKVSDATNTASEVGIVDAGGYYPGAGNVEVALQDAGAGLISGPGAALAVATDVLDQVLVASFDSVTWEVTVRNGILRYTAIFTVTHNGTLTTVEESNAAPSPGVGVLPITFDADISAGSLRLLATTIAPGWSYRVRRLALMTV